MIHVKAEITNVIDALALRHIRKKKKIIFSEFKKLDLQMTSLSFLHPRNLTQPAFLYLKEQQ